jgi:hypothetical protein
MKMTQDPTNMAPLRAWTHSTEDELEEIKAKIDEISEQECRDKLLDAYIVSMNMVQETAGSEEALQEISEQAQQTRKTAFDIGSDNAKACVRTRESMEEIFFGYDVSLAGVSLPRQSTSRPGASPSDGSGYSRHSKQQVSLIECTPCNPNLTYINDYHTFRQAGNAEGKTYGYSDGDVNAYWQEDPPHQAQGREQVPQDPDPEAQGREQDRCRQSRCAAGDLSGGNHDEYDKSSHATTCN